MSSEGPSPVSSGAGNVARACTACARAKAKCTPLDGGDGTECQRCHRLQKDCQPMPLRPRAAPRKRKPLGATRIGKHRVEKLEEKLDGLVMLLKSAHNVADHPSSAPTQTLAPPVQATKTSTPIIEQDTTNLDGTVVLENTLQPSPTNLAPELASASQLVEQTVQSASPKHSHSDEIKVWEDRVFNGGRVRQRFGLPPVGSHEADGLGLPPRITPPHFQLGPVDLGEEDPNFLLDIFRREMNPNFPFISVPDNVTVEQLRADRPTLFTAIIAVTSRRTPQQILFGKKVMQQLAERIVVNQERNMDLLLGALAYSGWCSYHFFNIAHTTALMGLLTTLVADLLLKGEATGEDPSGYVIALRQANGTTYTKPPSRTLEERRCVLGYFFLSSVVANFFHRTESIKWSPYLEECCNRLISSKDHRDDMAAVMLVKTQVVAEIINMSPWHRRSHNLDYPTSVPPALYMTSLKAQIKQIMTDYGPEVEANTSGLLHYQSLTIYLYKIGLSKTSLLVKFDRHDFNRLEYLFACFQAIKLFDDTFFALPATKFHCLPISVLSSFAHNHGILQLLSTFDHPDWDLQYVRKNLSFLEVLGKLVAHMGSVKFALNLDPHTTEGLDIYSKSARKSAWIKSYFENKEQNQQEGTSNPNEYLGVAGEFFMGYDPMDIVDDTWMQNFLCPWDD